MKKELFNIELKSIEYVQFPVSMLNFKITYSDKGNTIVQEFSTPIIIDLEKQNNVASQVYSELIKVLNNWRLENISMVGSYCNNRNIK